LHIAPSLFASSRYIHGRHKINTVLATPSTHSLFIHPLAFSVWCEQVIRPPLHRPKPLGTRHPRHPHSVCFVARPNHHPAALSCSASPLPGHGASSRRLADTLMKTVRGLAPSYRQPGKNEANEGRRCHTDALSSIIAMPVRPCPHRHPRSRQRPPHFDRADEQRGPLHATAQDRDPNLCLLGDPAIFIFCIHISHDGSLHACARGWRNR
jgi:hypothetical protein